MMIKTINNMDSYLFDPELLKKIIKTQANLAQENFDLDAFMQLVVNGIQLLTPATGAVVELVKRLKSDSLTWQTMTI